MYPVCAISDAVIGTVIVSEIRFLRECLSEVLARDPGVAVHGVCSSFAEALDTTREFRPEIVLLDAAFPDGLKLVRGLRCSLHQTQFVAIAVVESDETILAWAEAGIAGYVPNTASLQELTSLLKQISRGEQPCSTRIAGALLRHIGGLPSLARLPKRQSEPLTGRELEIMQLLGSGLSNKDIARRLDISLATTKSHVHSVLGKLRLRRRTEVAAQLHSLLRRPSLTDLIR